LIVGAGIGGLAAAVALRRAGWEPRVYEQAASPRELGFALNLAPNAMAALAELGLAEPLLAGGAVIARAEVRGARGELLRRVALPAAPAAAGPPGVIALRPLLHGALLDAVTRAPGALVLERRAVGFTARADGVELRLADGRTAEGDVLVGADGVASVIRRALHPHEPAPRASGYWAVRGVADGPGADLGDLDALAHLGDGLEAAAVRANRTAVYWYLSLLDADLDDAERDPARVAARRIPRFDPRFQSIVGATAPDDLRLDELFERDPIASWGRGPVTLVGDAAHPMLPHSGQGAAQAIEDAVALGLALGATGDPGAALRRYERIRAARTRRFVAMGRRVARITTTHNAIVRAVRDAVVRAAPARALAAAMLPRNRRDPHRALR
jgi:2-polyprenyl-6-methoxyphenol hydroxylase-like FAD-dependent oxidoreductase